MSDTYDYIITGAGCAGLSLLKRMMQHSFFADKKILLIDKEEKKINDRTWCFWEQGPGCFEHIVNHKWKQIDLYSNYFSGRFDLAPYEYKMVRGIDLYTSVLSEAKRHTNIEFRHERVDGVFEQGEQAVVKAGGTDLYSNYAFNSILWGDWKKAAVQQKHIYILLQHFKGWLIETRENAFNERIATFMDFRVSQERGTTFVYVLPLSQRSALVEYTLFSEEILSQEVYETELSNYIQNVLNIGGFSITHSEFGVIPMTNYAFQANSKRIIHIGTSGGYTKASSGYTFQFIQKNCTAIIEALVKNEDPATIQPVSKKRFNLYDRIFLNVLHNRKMGGDLLFAQLFKKNPTQKIFKFLDNETSFAEDLKIMSSVPLNKFLPAALVEIFHS